MAEKDKKGLFGRKKGKKVAVFVDFEHWCFALDNVFRMQPDIPKFYEDLTNEYDVKSIMFFGDFMNPALEKQMNEIRKVTNDIIDTHNPDAFRKDYTDFIMLDYIYQCAAQNKKIDTYVLFTGDGHFSSVMHYLQNKLKKKVVIFGVRDSISKKLKSSADRVVEYPGLDAQRNIYYDMLVENFRYISKNKQKNIYPTFLSTITTVARLHNVPEEDVREALQELIDKKIVYKTEVVVNQGENTVRVLRLDRSRAIDAGLYVVD